MSHEPTCLDEPRRTPLGVTPVRARHVLELRRVAAGLVVRTQVRGHALVVEEALHSGRCRPHVDAFGRNGVRHAVVMALEFDVVVGFCKARRARSPARIGSTTALFDQGQNYQITPYAKIGGRDRCGTAPTMPRRWRSGSALAISEGNAEPTAAASAAAAATWQRTRRARRPPGSTCSPRWCLGWSRSR